jgi:hypothetical protein
LVNRQGGTKAGDVAGYLAQDGYLIISIRQRGYQAHRLAWLYMHGEWPQKYIDHINCDKLDNRIANLRDVTARVNSENRKRAPCNNKYTGLMGVSYGSKNSWKATIVVRGKARHLGNFPSPEMAHEAYVAAKREHHEGCTL